MSDKNVIVAAKVIVLLTGYFALLLWIYTLDNPQLLLTFLTLSLMVPIFYLVNDRYKQRQHIAYLQQETLKSELNLLKSQINPHFFFNTLNNLYGLAIEKSDLTEQVIYKLSQMMHFTIYEGRKNTVSVEDEVQYLQNFIELHQIRYLDKVDITFTQEVEDSTQRIPPLLFINLLENAFKHGVESQSSGQFIRCKLTTAKEAIAFEIENNFAVDAKAQDKDTRKLTRSGGIGLENLRRRLELLFPDRHEFDAVTKDNVYKTWVKIDLS